jgi:hypothetical protein
MEMFVKTNVVTKEVAAPQTPIQYVHEVLVPEVCIMLIQQDKDVAYKEAQKIMEESNEFGSHLFPAS